MTNNRASLPPGPLISLIIPTRNRIGELVQTLESCLGQTWPHKEILVVDDASADGTYETVRSRFPEIDIVRRERNGGSVAARNDMLRRARGKYVVALDDDSRLIDPDACERVVARFEAEPDLGILAFHVIGPEFPERSADAEAWTGEWHCSSFGAGAAALRRSMLARTGLFPEFFFHAYEEPDLALRAWDAGYRVVRWNAIRVYHAYSPLNRSERRTHRYHARNEACSVWMRYPWHLVVPATVIRLARQFRHAARRGWALQEPRVWAEALLRIPRALRHRRPVRTRAVKIALALNRFNVTDASKVWELGGLGWSQVFSRPPRPYFRPASDDAAPGFEAVR